MRLRFQSGAVKNKLRSNGASKTFCRLLNCLILPITKIVAAGAYSAEVVADSAIAAAPAATAGSAATKAGSRYHEKKNYTVA